MYISLAPAAAAGATVLGVSQLADTGSHSLTLTLVAVALLAIGLLLVAWTAKHPRR